MRTIALALLLLVSGVAAAAAERPRDLVEKSAETVLSTLVQRREEFRREPAKLEAFILGELDRTFDHQYSARLVLGRHGRGVPDAQIEAFSKALSANLMRRYGKAMLDFDPKIDIKVLGETPLRDGSVMRVSTQLERADGPPVPVDYMLREVGAEWKVFDVLVEGVSYVQTFRAQFEEQLRDHTLDQVIAGLRDGTVDVAK